MTQSPTNPAAGDDRVNESMRLVEYDMLNRRTAGDGFVGERKEVAAIITALRHCLAQPQSGDVGAAALVQEMLDNLKHCSLNSGCCRCGDNMDRHGDPMSCGHTPVDMGWTSAETWIGKAEAFLAALPNPDAPPQADTIDAARRAALEEVVELRALSDAATPGEWSADDAAGESYFGIFAESEGHDALAYLAEPAHVPVPLPRERGYAITGEPKRRGEHSERFGEYTRYQEHEANAKLIAAAVNHVRRALAAGERA